MEEKKEVTDTTKKSNKKVIKGKRLTIYIIVIIIIAMSITFGCGYILRDKLGNNKKEEQETKKDEVKDNNTEQTTEENVTFFDIEKVENDLKDNISNGKKAYIIKCTDLSDENGINTDKEYIEVSSDTIDVIIDKLNSSELVESGITFSWHGCPPKQISYYVTDSDIKNQDYFTLSYGEADNRLLVEYNGSGYAFFFNSSEEINNFIESLE